MTTISILEIDIAADLLLVPPLLSPLLCLPVITVVLPHYLLCYLPLVPLLVFLPLRALVLITEQRVIS
jgi:hypothetical protein